MARFLRLHQSGNDDYTHDRDGWQEDMTLDQVLPRTSPAALSGVNYSSRGCCKTRSTKNGAILVSTRGRPVRFPAEYNPRKTSQARKYVECVSAGRNFPKSPDRSAHVSATARPIPRHDADAEHIEFS